ATAAQQLRLLDVNASCPGEATGGFLSLIGTDNGCRLYRLLDPLHVRYRGTQMNFAIDFLRSHPNVRLVTIDLGANDVFVLQDLSRTLPTPPPAWQPARPWCWPPSRPTCAPSSPGSAAPATTEAGWSPSATTRLPTTLRPPP